MSFLNPTTQGVKLYGSITIPLSSSTYGTHFSHFGVGGFVEVPDINERNNIPIQEEINADGISSGRRKIGMLVYTISENKYFRLLPYNASTGNRVTSSEWNSASNAQKMVWLDPMSSREEIGTFITINGSGNPNECWEEVFFNAGIPITGNFLPLSGGTITGNLTVDGSFMVNGSATFVNSENLIIEDPLIFLAQNNPANLVDIGIVGQFVNSPTQFTGLVRDHQVNEWFLFSGLTGIELTATDIDFTDSNLKIDTLHANLIGNILSSTLVFGNLSAQDNVYGANLNYREWDSTYTTVCANSAKWETAYSTVSSTILHKGNSFGETVIIGSNDPYSLVFETSGIPRMTILSGGSVGIGTSNPNHTLTVSGDISANVLRLTNATSNATGIQFGTDTNLYRSAANTLRTDDSFIPLLNASTTSDTVVVAQTNSNNTLQKRTINSQVWNTTAIFITGDSSFALTQNYIPKADNPSFLKNSQIIDNGVNVGIGTSAPSEKLTIVGSISASDYVFQRTKLKFVTTNYTFSAEDQNLMVLFNPLDPVSAVVPNDSQANFQTGATVNFTTLSAIVYVAGEPGVTIRSADGRNYLRTTNSAATILKLGSNDWLLFGDIWSDTLG